MVRWWSRYISHFYQNTQGVIFIANLSHLIENEYLLKMIDRPSLLSAHEVTERLNKLFIEQKESLKNNFRQIASKIKSIHDKYFAITIPFKCLYPDQKEE